VNLNVVQKLLSTEHVRQVRARLEQGPWVDGRATAGVEAARSKRNLQLAVGSPAHAQLSELVKKAVSVSEPFKQFTLPRRLSVILFSRYDVGMEYGPHTDDAFRSLELVRTDIAVTLFLSEPESYEGGALCVGDRALRAAAGDAVVYPASTIHRVSEVTRGVRLAAVFWVQSLVRDERQRLVLSALQHASEHVAEPGAALALSRAQQELLRMWLEP
jgi:PKHD-type hydroxylase